VDAFDFEKPSKEEKTTAPALLNHELLMERSKPGKMVTYSTTRAYADGQYLKHSKFGVGYVLIVRDPAVKMVVLFADQKRLMVCEIGPSNEATEPEASRDTPPKTAKPSESQESIQSDSSKSDKGTVECPVCGKKVHPYNLSQNPRGKVLGCMFCKQSR
jgi:hypothetical protein